MNSVFDFFGGRKMTVALLLSIISVVFLLLDKANFDQWANFMMWTFGIFALGNVGSHFSHNIQRHTPPAPRPNEADNLE